MGHHLEPNLRERPIRFAVAAVVRWAMTLFVFAVLIFFWPVQPNAEMRSKIEEMKELHSGRYRKSNPVIAIDYTMPIYKRRLWLIDSETGKVKLNTHVGHAWNSGLLWAANYSNVPNTEKSSFGAFVTQESYSGQFGYAMRIRGLQSGVNDNARNRAIVFHGADIPWSAGCFVTPPDHNKQIIDQAKNGSLIVVKAPIE